MKGGWHKWCNGMSITTTMNTITTITTFISLEMILLVCLDSRHLYITLCIGHMDERRGSWEGCPIPH